MIRSRDPEMRRGLGVKSWERFLIQLGTTSFQSLITNVLYYTKYLQLENLKIDILLKLGSFDDENVAKKEKNVGKNMRKMTKINQNLWAIAIFGIFVHIKSKSNKKGFILITFRPQRRI